jgi:uncharacterized protein
MKSISIVLFVLPIFLFSEKGYVEPWGKDNLLSYKPHTEKTASKKNIFAFSANKAILFHQKIISPVCGSRSNFRPTSSRYMQLAIERYGFFKGFAMGCDRLLRENSDPWVYKKIVINDTEYKFDPALESK